MKEPSSKHDSPNRALLHSLHSGLVLSRNIRRSSGQKVYDAIWYARIESAGALLVAFFINLAIIATNAAAFFSAPCTGLDNGPYACLGAKAFNASGDSRHMSPDGQGTPCTQPDGGAGQCGEIGLSSEGYALADALGESSLYIWALGLLAAGQASTMVCTYAGQMIMGGCLRIQMVPWKRVALTRAFALGPALFVSVATGSDTSLFNNINEYLNILQSVQLPFAMLPVLHFAASRKLLGIFASTTALFSLSCVLALLVISINVLLVVEFIRDPPNLNVDEKSTQGMPPIAIGIISVAGTAYFAVCIRENSENQTSLESDQLVCMVHHADRYPHTIPRSGMMWDEVILLGRILKRVFLPSARPNGLGQAPMLSLSHGAMARSDSAQHATEQADACPSAAVLSESNAGAREVAVT